MALTEKASLVARLSPPIDHFLATQLLDEFVDCERRFILGDWEPAELNGGQFCEILGRILFHADSGNLNRTKDFSECIKYIEVDSNPHALAPRHNAIHLGIVLRTIYKFRSQRGAVHITPNYKANHQDSRLIIECVRWCFNETLRIFWNSDKEAVAKAIRELLQFDVPCVGKFSDVILVQRTDLSADEEVLVLLHYAGEAGFSRNELGKYALIAPSSVTRALQKLTSASVRQVLCLPNGYFRLTDLGAKYVREKLPTKLGLSI